MNWIQFLCWGVIKLFILSQLFLKYLWHDIYFGYRKRVVLAVGFLLGNNLVVSDHGQDLMHVPTALAVRLGVEYGINDVLTI